MTDSPVLDAAVALARDIIGLCEMNQRGGLSVLGGDPALQRIADAHNTSLDTLWGILHQAKSVMLSLQARDDLLRIYTHPDTTPDQRVPLLCSLQLSEWMFQMANYARAVREAANRE